MEIKQNTSPFLNPTLTNSADTGILILAAMEIMEAIDRHFLFIVKALLVVNKLVLEIENGSRIVVQFDADKNTPAYYILDMEQIPNFVMLTKWDDIEQYEKLGNNAALFYALNGHNTVIAGYESSILKFPQKTKNKANTLSYPLEIVFGFLTKKHRLRQ